MLLLLTVLLVSALGQSCTYTQYEWLQVMCPSNGTLTLCDADWCTLLAINVAGMLRPENRPWVLAAQQYIAAFLNAEQDFFAVPATASLLYVGGSLEMACDNMSQWQLTDSLADALSVLYVYNHGNMSCPPLNGSVALLNDTFYYTQPPYLMTLRDGVSNLTMSFSALSNLYSTQQFLLIVSILEFVTIALMGLKLVINRNDKRHYMWMLKNANPCVEAAVPHRNNDGVDDGIELNSIEELDGDHQEEKSYVIQ